MPQPTAILEAAGAPESQAETASPQSRDAAAAVGRACSGCGFALEAASRFCPECGQDLLPGAACPQCHRAVGAGGDFCEGCGFWLLGGRCRFCYSPLAEGQAFCPECGNPSAGASCPHCGTVGFFDYCPGCRRPLTEAAHALEQQLAAEPEVRAFLEARARVEALLQEASRLETELEEEGARPAQPSAEEQARRARDAAMLANLDAIERRLRAQAAPAQSGSAPAPAAARPAAPARLAAPRPDAESLARRARLAELKAEAAAQAPRLAPPAVLRRSFSSNQEARRYFMACRPPRTRGWRCFAYDAIHDLPMHCAEPGKGGEWLVE